MVVKFCIENFYGVFENTLYKQSHICAFEKIELFIVCL